MPIEHTRLNNSKGDITKADTYQALISGQDAIISAIGLGPSRKATTVYSRGMRNVLQAMQAANVNRVLSITGIGAGDSKGHGGFVYDKIVNPLMLEEDYLDKTRQEQLLKDSTVDWTIVRPGFLHDQAAQQNYRVLRDMQGVVSGEIARADVAHFLINAVERGSHIKQTIFLSN